MRVTTLLLIIVFTAFSAGAQSQEPNLDGLEEYLRKQMAGPDAIQVIKRHLVDSGASEPLNELVAWAKAGFPDLHDESGIWKTEGLSLKLGVIRSIHYYFSTSPPENKSERYLSILNELQRDDYISYHLTDAAYLFVDEAVLEGEVLKLLREKDPKLRSQGALMGRTLAEHKRPLFERYVQMLTSDDNAHTRLTFLHSIISFRPERSCLYCTRASG